MIFLFFGQLSNRLQEGGPVFMYPLLLMLLLCIALIIYVFIKGDDGRFTKLIGHVGLFALVWGFLGQMIGLVTAFDSIEAFSDMSPNILATGIKIALLNPIFGMLVFLIARLGIIALLFKKK